MNSPRSPPLANLITAWLLEADQLPKLVQGFKGSTLFPIVATAAFTGTRRNEILALQWDDLDAEKKTLRIERALEETDAHGLRIKGPKTERGKRTIAIDDQLIALLLAERERYLRVMAGVSDRTTVDLSLVKLPEGALMFPNPPARGEDFSFTKLRNPRNTTKEFVRTRRCCSTRVCRCMSSPPGADMILR